MVTLKEEESSHGEGVGSFTPHPLLVDHIVETILEYVDSNIRRDAKNGINNAQPTSTSTSECTFLSYRLVCRLWNEIATKLYRSKNHQVEVGSYSTTVPKFRRLIKLQKTNPYHHNPGSSCSSNSSKLRRYKQNWTTPFVKFRLCQEVFQPLYSSIITDFFQTFQDSLEVLDIWLDLRSTLHQVPIHSKSRLCSFPNLKTLVYDDRRVILEGRKDVRGSLLKSLVELSPNLRRLQIRFQRDYRGSVECGSEVVLKNMRCLFSSHSLQKSLKELRLDLHLNDQLFTSLNSAEDLKLEILELAIRGSTFSFPSLRQFLENQRSTLRKLKLSYIERDSSCLISIPKMKALTEFEVDGTDSFSKHSVSLGDFTYSECLPRLSSLRVNIWGQAHLRWGQFFPTRATIHTLTELKLPGELCDTPMISCISKAFPNLTRLSISVYSGTLNVLGLIFERLGNLEELTVTKFPSLWDRNEKNIDDILTGINAQNCDKLWKENVALGAMTEEDMLDLKTKAGLTDLKKLRRLSMPDLQYQASYTDITGYLAFGRMPSLRYLNVGRSYMSSACLLTLVEKFPEMETQRKLPPGYFKEPEEEDDGSFLELPGDTCVYL